MDKMERLRDAAKIKLAPKAQIIDFLGGPTVGLLSTHTAAKGRRMRKEEEEEYGRDRDGTYYKYSGLRLVLRPWLQAKSAAVLSTLPY